MPRITEAGPVRITQAEYNRMWLDVFRAGLGENMQTGADTFQGLVSRAGARLCNQIEVAVLNTVRGLNLDTMVGIQLDNAAVGFQLTRRAATRSTGTVTLTGTAGTTIPAGSEVQSTNGDVFVTDAEVTIPSAGTVNVAVTADEFGVVQASAATITTIVDARPGWTAVTNAAAVMVGRDAEADSAFRARIREARDRNGFGYLAAIRGRLLSVDGVTHVAVLDNRTTAEATVRGITIAAGGIAAVTEGGADADIAEALYLATVPGQVFSGSTSIMYTPRGSPSGAVTVQFTKATAVPVKIVLAVTGNQDFPGDGLAQIRANLLAFWAGTFSAGTYVSTPVGVGDLPSLDNMRTVIGQTPGVTVTSLALQLKMDDSAITSVDADDRLTLLSNDIGITLTTV